MGGYDQGTALRLLGRGRSSIVFTMYPLTEEQEEEEEEEEEEEDEEEDEEEAVICK